MKKKEKKKLTGLEMVYCIPEWYDCRGLSKNGIINKNSIQKLLK